MKETPRIPLYTQIRDYLYDRIRKGDWKHDDRLPSEKELAEQFKVSRVTVKNALSELMDKGLVYRIQGKGSFVSSNRGGEPQLYKSPTTDKMGSCIAFLIPRLESTFSAGLVRGVEEACRAAGMKMILGITNDSQEEETRQIGEMMQLGVEGIIIFPVDGEAYNEEILKLTISNYPLVLIDRYFRGIETNNVCTDNFTAAFDLTNHLIQEGHRNIGVISTNPKWTTSIEDRLDGYEKALSDAQIPINRQFRLDHFDPDAMNLIVREGVMDEQIQRELQAFLRANPEITAIFATNIAVGISLILAAKENGLQLPEQLSVVYFDYEPLSTFLFNQPYIRQDVASISQQAVALLMAVIAEPTRKRERILIDTQMIANPLPSKWSAPLPVQRP